MFSQDVLVLTRKGPLAKVWLAAHLEHAIKAGDHPIALRLSGQLLLGVVRIYSRKTKYLLEDASETLIKIRLAFQPGKVDLPAEQQKASTASITVPEVMTERDLMVPSSPIVRNTLLSRPQDITLKDAFYAPLTMYSSLSQLLEDDVDPLAMDQGNSTLRFDLDGDVSMFSVEQVREGRVSDVHLDGVDASKLSYHPQEDVFGLDAAFGPELQDLAPLDMGQEHGLDVSLHMPDASALDVSLHAPAQQQRQRGVRKRQWMDTQTQLSDAAVRAGIRDTSDITVKRRLLDASSMSNMLQSMEAQGGVAAVYLQQQQQQAAPFGYGEDVAELLLLPLTQLPQVEPEAMRQLESVLDVPDAAAQDMHLEPPLFIEAEHTLDHDGLLLEPPMYMDHELDASLPMNLEPSSILEHVPLNSSPAGKRRAQQQRRLFGDDGDGMSQGNGTMPTTTTQTTVTLSKSTKKAIEILRDEFTKRDDHVPSVPLNTIIEPTTSRSDAARMFFEMLVLGTKGALTLQQSQPFGPIDLVAQPRLFDVSLME